MSSPRGINSGTPFIGSRPFLDIINWPVQKQKLWRGKEHITSWSEIRRVARAAIEDALTALFIGELIDLVKDPCRDAGIKAFGNKRDKSAQLKSDYYNVVMDMLQGVVHEEAGRTQARNARTKQLTLVANTPLTRRQGPSRIVLASGDVEAEEVGRDLWETERATEQPGQDVCACEAGMHRGAERERQPVEPQHGEAAGAHPRIEASRHTGVHPGSLQELLHPEIRQVPDPSHEDGLELEDAELVSWLGSLTEDDLKDLDEIEGSELDDWVTVEHDPNAGWVAVLPEWQ
ncbi:hypothetical protein BT67DRAFT_435762 [Trichocladium antarcticum]|uniref:Uncharacterized protein n=1 Tax=Trichocladium antarcticum TaxID=1450529 RepID=A0AAN6UGB4_9PEZI|nr:hypothetical protein BT67DRAFT_435762 [Trichocladium antarcticum]